MSYKIIIFTSTMKQENEQLAKITAKIKALLSKTIDNGATEQEMLASMQKATELMQQHFITQYDIDKSSLAEKCVFKTIPMFKSAYKLEGFMYELGQLFDCQHYWNDYYKTVTFYGYQQDTELCAYFYNLILKTCIYEKDRFTHSDEYWSLRGPIHSRTLTASFVKGFLSGVSRNLQALYENRTRSVEQKYGLMIIEKNEDVLRQFSLEDLTISPQKLKEQYYVESAFHAGKDKGLELEIIQGLDEAKTETILKIN